MSSPPVRDTRGALVDTAARLLGEEGPQALTARRLATELGTSTMAVYTYVGGMDELRRAVRDDGFARLAAAWGAIRRTGDPVSDLSVSGATYASFALRKPHLYRAMFFATPPDDRAAPLDVAGVELELIGRCVAAGRFGPADPWSIAWQLWAATHGVVAGVFAGVVDGAAAEGHLRALALSLYVGLGDDRRAAERSIARARRRIRRRTTGT